jgi:hypothetical protein
MGAISCIDSLQLAASNRAIECLSGAAPQLRALTDTREPSGVVPRRPAEKCQAGSRKDIDTGIGPVGDKEVSGHRVGEADVERQERPARPKIRRVRRDRNKRLQRQIIRDG